MEDFLKDVYTSIYKKWILFQQIDNCQIMLSSKDQNKIILETKYGVANVIFYKFNIIELNVISKIDQESCFFLHFQMNNINHAINLFYEMVECLKTLIKKPKIKILLCCSGGLTTTYFAYKIDEAIQLFALDYEIAATGYNELFKKGEQYDVILLAPQVSFMYAKVKKIFKDKYLLNIPAQVFAKYDVKEILKTRLCLNHCKDIFLLGLSALIGELATGIVMLLFNFTLLKYSGNIGVAAYGIIANIAFVIVSMFTGVAQGIQPIISKNLSFKEYRNVNLAYHYGLWTVIIFAVIVYLSSYFAAAQIVALFNSSSNPELLDLAVRGIHIYFGGFIFAGVNMISATFFSASDKSRQAFIISSLRGFILIAPVIFILSTIFKVDGVWLTYVVTELITSIITIILKRKSDFSLH